MCHGPLADVQRVNVSLDGHREPVELSFVDLRVRCDHEGLFDIVVFQLVMFDVSDLLIRDAGLRHCENTCSLV